MGGVGSRHRRGEVCRSTGLRIERLDRSSRIVVVEVVVVVVRVVAVVVRMEDEADEEYKELDIVVEPQVDGERAMVTGPFSLTGA